VILNTFPYQLQVQRDLEYIRALREAEVCAEEEHKQVSSGGEYRKRAPSSRTFVVSLYVHVLICFWIDRWMDGWMDG